MAEKLLTEKGYPARILGATGQKVSIIAFGGIIVMNETQDTANRYVGNAVSRGITLTLHICLSKRLKATMA